jgi:hypothetical protein
MACPVWGHVYSFPGHCIQANMFLFIWIQRRFFSQVSLVFSPTLRGHSVINDRLAGASFGRANLVE